MRERARWHQKVTEEAILAACDRRATSLDNPGFCLACGLEAEGCEPDMREGRCPSCGRREVYGADELLLVVAMN